MSKYIDKYNKDNYKVVSFRLKKDEYNRFESMCKKAKLTRRQFIIKIMNRSEINENNI